MVGWRDLNGWVVGVTRKISAEENEEREGRENKGRYRGKEERRDSKEGTE